MNKQHNRHVISRLFLQLDSQQVSSFHIANFGDHFTPHMGLCVRHSIIALHVEVCIWTFFSYIIVLECFWNFLRLYLIMRLCVRHFNYRLTCWSLHMNLFFLHYCSWVFLKFFNIIFNYAWWIMCVCMIINIWNMQYMQRSQ
jgi:hypothetical protein